MHANADDAVVTLLQRGAVTRDKQEDEDLRDGSEKPPPMRGKDPMKGVGGVGRRSAAALPPDDWQEPRGLDPPVLEEKEIGPPWSVSRYHVMGSLAYRLFHGPPPHGAIARPNGGEKSKRPAMGAEHQGS
jgi:hypothetical protein